MKKYALLALCLFLIAGSFNCGGRKVGSQTLTIAVIPKGTTHEYWKSIHAGAVKAMKELSGPKLQLSIDWKGPLKEDDREQQIQVVEGFLSQGINGIVLAPLDNRALVRPVEEAQKAGIPTVIIDSALDSDNIASFVATDNYKGGALAADRLASVMHNQGKVILLRYAEGSASTTAREAGFLDRIKAYKDIQIISSDQYAGPTRDTAKQASENLLNRFGNDVQGIFTVNESATSGMLLALQDIGKAGKVSFVGFDVTQPFIDALHNKQLDGIVVQDPFKMGYLGVKTMVDYLQGKAVSRRIDTGVTMITPDTVDQSASQALLHPPLDQYLN